MLKLTNVESPENTRRPKDVSADVYGCLVLAPEMASRPVIFISSIAAEGVLAVESKIAPVSHAHCMGVLK